ncbi:MAG: DUF5123 domain-containing protein [Polyangiaceae bacterium]|nr:DUF5123 domain-containing protein [Polyangiaceae bacterium]
MKRLFLSVLGVPGVLCMLGGAAYAATSVPSGDLNGNVTWTAAGSPYNLDGDVTIVAGSSLTIEAGVTVQVKKGDTANSGTDKTKTELIVNGSLETQGTKENPVVFTSAEAGPATDDWYGIRVLSGGAMALRWTNFSYGSYCIDASPGTTGSVNVVGGRAESCAVGVSLHDGAPIIDGMTVTKSTSYGFNVDTANAVLNNVISTGNSYGIYISQTTSASSTVNIANATVANNTTDGVYGQKYNAATSSLSINIVNSIISNNKAYGVGTFTTGNNNSNATFAVSYSDVWGNTTSSYYGYKVSAGTGTISVNPLFVDAANDYHLQPNSPCIDTGTTTTLTTDADGNPRVVDGGKGAKPDMGAYEYRPCEVSCGDNGTCNAATRSCACNPGFAGSGCQYSDAETCNSHGAAQMNGNCACSDGFAGANCELSDAVTCNSHGAVQMNGSCACANGFDDGANCSQCKADYYTYPTCAIFCEASATCGDHGTCNKAGGCACANGFDGANCEFSDAVTCNDHGTTQADGSCVCSAGFNGSVCQFSDAVTCNGHGTAQTDGSCVCSAGFAGARCEYSDAANCNSRGQAQADGSCKCSHGFAGPKCEYSDATTCNSRGQAQANGSCKCSVGFAGVNCEYSDAEACNSHGTVQANGSCSCNTGFSGDKCSAGTCNASTTCSGQGTCDAAGGCSCNTGFSGASCNQCVAGYSGYPTCVQDTNAGEIDGGADSGGTGVDSGIDGNKSGSPDDSAGGSGGGCSTSTGKTGNLPFAELGLASLVLIVLRRRSGRAAHARKV